MKEIPHFSVITNEEIDSAFFRTYALTEKVKSKFDKGISAMLGSKRLQVKSMSTHGYSDKGSQFLKAFTVELNEHSMVILASGETPAFYHYPIALLLQKELGMENSPAEFVIVDFNKRPSYLALLREDTAHYFREKYHNEDILVYRSPKDGVIEPKKNDYENKYESDQLIADLNSEKVLGWDDSQIESFMNLDAYLKVLAFNRLMRNGDFADEIFWIGTRNNGKIYFNRFMGWDFEETFSISPHDSQRLFQSNGRESLIFSNENPLFRKIANSPRLYLKYKKILSELIKECTDNKIAFAFQQMHNVVDQTESQIDYELVYGRGVKKIHEELKKEEEILKFEKNKLLALINNDPT